MQPLLRRTCSQKEYSSRHGRRSRRRPLQCQDRRTCSHWYDAHAAQREYSSRRGRRSRRRPLQCQDRRTCSHWYGAHAAKSKYSSRHGRKSRRRRQAEEASLTPCSSELRARTSHWQEVPMPGERIGKPLARSAYARRADRQEVGSNPQNTNNQGRQGRMVADGGGLQWRSHWQRGGVARPRPRPQKDGAWRLRGNAKLV